MKPTLIDAIISLVPDAEVSVANNKDILWHKPELSPVTEEQIHAELVKLESKYLLTACKEKAKQLLAQTDWAVLPDVGLANQDAFVFYRLNLRNLVKNPVADPVFEDVPQAIWS